MPSPPTDPLSQLRELVERMGKARNPTTLVYMPAALLAVYDLAEQGKLHTGIVQVADYKLAFKSLMLEVWREREDMWWRPMLHATEHGMWRPLWGGHEVEKTARQISRLSSEKQARKVADAFRLDPVLHAALADQRRRDELRRLVYELLRRDGGARSTKLAELHADLDPSQADSEQLRDLLIYEHRFEDRDAFEDLRQRALVSRVVRNGQMDFRRRLLEAYDNRCCMSGTDAPPALEAAHIFPYRGEHTNRVPYGLLLRADLHVLFDAGLVTVDVGSDPVIVLHGDLTKTEYRTLEGRKLTSPKRPSDTPDRDALDWHRRKNRP